MLHNRCKQLQSGINAIKQETMDLQGLSVEMESAKVKLNNICTKYDKIALENK